MSRTSRPAVKGDAFSLQIVSIHLNSRFVEVEDVACATSGVGIDFGACGPNIHAENPRTNFELLAQGSVKFKPE